MTNPACSGTSNCEARSRTGKQEFSAGRKQRTDRDDYLKKYGKIWIILGKILGAALSLAVLAGLYFTLVIAQPQPDTEEEKAVQPLLTASPALQITDETELRTLVGSFPAPVMSFMSGSGMTFVSGKAEDAAYREGYGRILTLYWQTAEGEPLILQSIYPAAALELMGKGDYSFSRTAGPVLFGMSSVRMENSSTVRVHAQVRGEGLYVLTIPQTLKGSLSGIARSIQLFTAD